MEPDIEFALILECVRSWKPSRVLEVGANFGRELKAIENLCHVYGIDRDKLKIDQAKKYVPTGTFTCVEAEKLPYENDFFDLVYSDGCLSHNPPETVPGIIAEMLRVCRQRLILVEYQGTRQTSDPNSYTNCKPNRWVHDYDRLLIGGKDDVVSSKSVVFGYDKFAFLTLTKGLLAPHPAGSVENTIGELGKSIDIMSAAFDEMVRSAVTAQIEIAELKKVMDGIESPINRLVARLTKEPSELEKRKWFKN